MINSNKIVSLAIFGAALGGIVGTIVNSGQVNMLTAAIVGGVSGFLAGWIWKSRSERPKE